MAEKISCTTQLIDGEGEFNAAGLETFTRTVKLSELGLSYAVVAIIGPQSSGKSTLLNHLFNTNFREMDALKGRSQTTKGIWIARAVGIAPCTVIMDVEGCDGKERGKKDETAFEKQSALFALAVSDVVLINMWCHDIGREQAANRPLLKTVFQVMMQLFSPRKTTLLFVIRDKTTTPPESLEADLSEDIQQIWDTVQKPQAFKDTPLSDFFNVEVTALSTYEYQKDQFKEEVGQLRQRFFNSIAPGGLAGDRRGVVPASGFSNWSEKIWKDIKENRDLDLPTHRVMLASVRCDEIGSEQLTRLTSDESRLSLEKEVQAGPVPGFVQRLSSILETYLSEYDMMTLYYDENVRKTKRQEFESKALQLVHPAYVIFLQHLHSETLKSFKMSLEQTLHKGEEFDSSVGKYTQDCMKKFDFSIAGESGQETYWDASKVRGELLRDIEAHASAVRSAKLAEIVTGYEKLLDEALIAPVDSLFKTVGEDTWASIRKLLKRETDSAVAGFSSAISGFELDRDSMVQNLRNHARSVVEKKSKDEAGKVLIRMKERFSKVFHYDNCSVRRDWTGKEDIQAIKNAAWSASLDVLAVMAVMRLDGKPDEVEDILFSSLMEGTETTDLLASSSWEKVPPVATLITPLRCKNLWRKFKAETEVAVTKAISAQKAYRKKKAKSYASHAVGALTGVAMGAATVAAGLEESGTAYAVSTGVSKGFQVGGAVTKAAARAFGVPEAAESMDSETPIGEILKQQKGKKKITKAVTSADLFESSGEGTLEVAADKANEEEDTEEEEIEEEDTEEEDTEEEEIEEEDTEEEEIEEEDTEEEEIEEEDTEEEEEEEDAEEDGDEEIEALGGPEAADTAEAVIGSNQDMIAEQET